MELTGYEVSMADVQIAHSKVEYGVELNEMDVYALYVFGSMMIQFSDSLADETEEYAAGYTAREAA